jgi:NTE family protein
MRDHWDAGYRDTIRTLRHRDWLEMPETEGALISHDIHRVDD